MKLLICCILISFSAHARDEIHMVYYSNFAPLSWSVDGVMKGAFIDIVDQILVGKMGFEVKHIGLPWARAQLMVKKGEADGYLAGPTEARLSYATPTKLPLYQSPFNIFVKKGTLKIKEFKKIKALEDLRKYKLGSFLGHGWSQYQLKGFDVQYVNSLVQVLKMIKLDRVEIYIGSSLVTNYNIQLAGLHKDILEIHNPIELVDFHMFIGKKSPFYRNGKTIADFEKHYIKMKMAGDIKKIFKKYQTISTTK